MKIDGKAIADQIYTDLTDRVGELRHQKTTPTLAVILIGDDPSSISYVSQKEKNAAKIGVTLHIDRLPTTVTREQIAELVHGYNNDKHIHGIIIQRPAPEQLEKDFLDTLVMPEKDVDGFHPNSDFAAPVALAVERILREVFAKLSHHESYEADNFSQWLVTRDIVVMGKGETAGMPILSHFHNRNAVVTVIDSQTEHPEDILNEAEIIITAVGKADILPRTIVLRDKILVGVGLHGEDGKLRGDYPNAEVEEAAAFYTPTPGGVGPVNVAMLLSNVVRAAEEQTGNE